MYERSILDRLRVPIVQAPLAGGASTPELAVAAGRAGALGFLAAGYRSAAQLREEIAAVRRATSEPFGVNLFVPGPDAADLTAVHSFAARVRMEAAHLGAQPGAHAWSDDDWEAKLDVVRGALPAVVSFTFGSPPPGLVAELRGAGAEVWVTVTEPGEAEMAAAAGASALVVQGLEAGGHRGGFEDRDGLGEIGLLTLLRLVARRVDLPLVASGGLADGRAVAAVLVAGARAAQVGTAFLDTLEAGTSAAHREQLRGHRRTALTRAFSGRRARGIVNGFMGRNGAAAPAAYPHLHYLTAPMRAAAREAGEAELINLWAGQGYELIDHGVPARQVVERLGAELEAALREVGRRVEA